MEISLRQSNNGSFAYTLSYCRRGTGIPLEAKINYALGYSKMICKAEQVLSGYTLFSKDVFGNSQQEKASNSASLFFVRNELEIIERM